MPLANDLLTRQLNRSPSAKAHLPDYLQISDACQAAQDLSLTVFHEKYDLQILCRDCGLVVLSGQEVFWGNPIGVNLNLDSSTSLLPHHDRDDYQKTVEQQ